MPEPSTSPDLLRRLARSGAALRLPAVVMLVGLAYVSAFALLQATGHGRLGSAGFALAVGLMLIRSRPLCEAPVLAASLIPADTLVAIAFGLAPFPALVEATLRGGLMLAAVHLSAEAMRRVAPSGDRHAALALLLALAGLLLPATAGLASSVIAAGGTATALSFSWTITAFVGAAVVVPIGLAVSRQGAGPAPAPVWQHLLFAGFATVAIGVAMADLEPVFTGLLLAAAAVVLGFGHMAVLNALVILASHGSGLVAPPSPGADLVALALAAPCLTTAAFGVAPMLLAAARDDARRSAAHQRAADLVLARSFEAAAVGIAEIDRSGQVVRANPAFARTVGGDPVGRALGGLLAPEDRAALPLADLVAGRLRDHAGELRLLAADGRAIWHLAFASSLAEHGGGLLLQVMDIDARRQAEAELAAAGERARLAFESVSQGIWDANLAEGVEYYSPQWKAMLGYTDEELPSRFGLWTELMHPDDLPAALEVMRRQADGSIRGIDATFRLRHRNGQWVWVRDRGHIVATDAEGRAIRLVGTHTDVTAETVARHRAEALAERLRLATDAGGIGLWEYASETDCMWWNERMFAIYGLDAASTQPSGSGWFALMHPEDAPATQAGLDALRDGEDAYSGEFRIIRPDGETRVVRSSARLARDQTGREIIVGADLDVTEERRAIARLTAANVHMSQFAAIASHDLQAPARQIALLCDMLLAEAPGNLSGEQVETITRMQTRARHMRALIAGLLEFSRAGEVVDLTTVDVDALLEGLRQEMAREIADLGASVEIEPCPPVRADPVMLGQVFRNLLSNSLKYRSDEPPAVAIAGIRAYGEVTITITDNGRGIPRDHAETVFEIFRRLPQSRGTEGAGIGLALCRRLVEAMGGSITVDTAYTSGARFVVILRPAPMPTAIREDA